MILPKIVLSPFMDYNYICKKKIFCWKLTMGCRSTNQNQLTAVFPLFIPNFWQFPAKLFFWSLLFRQFYLVCCANKDTILYIISTSHYLKRSAFKECIMILKVNIECCQFQSNYNGNAIFSFVFHSFVTIATQKSSDFRCVLKMLLFSTV